MVTRAEHRHRTMLALSDAAIEVFEAQGPDATIDEIADRAGVSRRTVYRWVDQREDLVFIRPRLWIETFNDAVAEVAGQPLADRIRHASRAVSETVDADPDAVRRAMQVALAHPQLMRGYAAMNQAWVDRMVAECAIEAADQQGHFRARVLGGAIMGVIDAALAEWMVADPPQALITFIEAGLAQIDPILHSVGPPPT